MIEVRILNRPGHFRDHKSRLAATKTKHDVVSSLGVFTDTTVEFEAINSSPKKKMVIISTIQRSLSTAGKESPNYKNSRVNRQQMTRFPPSWSMSVVIITLPQKECSEHAPQTV